MAAVQGRILGASGDEVSSAAHVVARVLRHVIFDQAREAEARGMCRRETPVTYRDDAGSLVEGVVDLAFENDAGWTLVDFKTDQELAIGLDRYTRQVALYAMAIELATGKPVVARLMSI
jgi:ATP-dependent exoDNAse (exonuclease V) beta subunit